MAVIKIKPENKGKFTATKKTTGKSTEELTHSKNPITKKRAVFAQNAKKWHHKQDGGNLVPEKVLKYVTGGKFSKEEVKKAHEKPGGSNVGKKTFADGSKRTGPYAGPAGGAPAGSYPIPDLKHAKAAIKLSGHAPNPAGIKAAARAKFPQLKKKLQQGGTLKPSGYTQKYYDDRASYINNPFNPERLGNRALELIKMAKAPALAGAMTAAAVPAMYMSGYGAAGNALAGATGAAMSGTTGALLTSGGVKSVRGATPRTTIPQMYRSKSLMDEMNSTFDTEEQFDKNGNIHTIPKRQPIVGTPGFKCGGILKQKGGELKLKVKPVTPTADSTKYYSDKISSNINEFVDAKNTDGKDLAAKKVKQSKGNLIRQTNKGKAGYNRNGFPIT